jgi:hypothetical protein
VERQTAQKTGNAECYMPFIRAHEKRLENFYWLANKIFGGKV